jgi:signal recognition particle subunit SRP54
MTPGERQNPKVIDGSRRARIAAGSGVTVTAVNNLLSRFTDAQKMMKRMAGGMGIPGMPGGRGKASKAQKKVKKGRRVSGDPRKAALGKADDSAGEEPTAAPKQGVLGNLGGKLPPGMQLPPGFDPSKFNLPGQK